MQPPELEPGTDGPGAFAGDRGPETAAESPDPPALDPELQALPEPRRPWRGTTLAVLATVTLGSLWVIWGLLPPARFAISTAAPTEVGPLASLSLGPPLANTWVHGEGLLGERAVEYRRPLDRDRYRLTPVTGSSRLWVELRIPEGIEPERYVPPNSFVGRLVPLEGAGLGGTALGAALESAFGATAARDVWILFDGEAPPTSRWALGLVALFLGFAAFGAVGVVRLLAPARGAPPAR